MMPENYKNVLMTQSGSEVNRNFRQSLQETVNFNFDTQCAWNRCQDRLCRLDSMNSTIESMANASWTMSAEISSLSEQLSQNRMLPALRNKLLYLRLVPYKNKGYESQRSEDTTEATKLKDLERKVHDPKLINEFTTLISVQSQSVQMLMRMLNSSCDDIPWCKEEVYAIRSHIKEKFRPLLSRFLYATLVLENKCKVTAEPVNESSLSRCITRFVVRHIETITTAEFLSGPKSQGIYQMKLYSYLRIGSFKILRIHVSFSFVCAYIRPQLCEHSRNARAWREERQALYAYPPLAHAVVQQHVMKP